MKHSADFDQLGSAIIGLDDEYCAGFVDPPHRHARDQLLYASTGVMSVTTPSACFVIPPQRAIWIPRGVLHEVSCRGHVSLRTLYFANPPDGTDVCRVIEVSGLLRALIVETAKLGPSYEANTRNVCLLDLLVAELATMPAAPYHVPMPRDYRLLRVCGGIVGNPARQHHLDRLAELAGMSRRTFTRLFRAETGMSFTIWHRQVRLMQAMSLLSEGHGITSVAFDVGYDSPSAFTSVFHRSFGVTPSQYQTRLVPPQERPH